MTKDNETFGPMQNEKTDFLGPSFNNSKLIYLILF